MGDVNIIQDPLSYKLDFGNNIIFSKKREFRKGGRELNLRDYLAEHEADRCTRPRWDETDREKGEYDYESYE